MHRAHACCSSCSSRRPAVGYVQYFNDIPPLLVGDPRRRRRPRCGPRSCGRTSGCSSADPVDLRRVHRRRRCSRRLSLTAGRTVATPFAFDRAWDFAVGSRGALGDAGAHRPLPRVVAVVARARRRRRRPATAGRRRARRDPGAVAVPAALHGARRRGGAGAAPRGDGRPATSRARRASSCEPDRDGTDARLVWELEVHVVAAAPAVGGGPPGARVGARPHRGARARAVREARARQEPTLRLTRCGAVRRRARCGGRGAARPSAWPRARRARCG